jgi:uncharacterized protein YutE (UPF0331/DUF86 family)
VLSQLVALESSGEVMQIPYQVVAYFSVELGSYKLFIEMSERNWVEELERYTLSILEDHEPTLHRFNYRNDLTSKLSDEYPQYQRKSYLIMLVSIFEDFMNQLCRSVEAHLELKASFTDFNGSGIERAKQYLSKLSSLSLPVSGKEWKLIRDAQAIRNIIAHAAGHIDKKAHLKQLKIINGSENLAAEYYARTHLNIDNEYILNLVGAMQDFSGKLLIECDKLSNKKTNKDT